MSRAPSMPVFAGDLLGDTMHLSNGEFGSYLLILLAMWRNRGVAFTDDDTRLARIARVTPKVWRDRMRPALVGFFDLTGDGSWKQNRLTKEWNFVEAQRLLNSAAGKASARARELKRNEPGSTNVAVRLQPNRQRKSNPQPLKEEESLEDKSSKAGEPAFPPARSDPQKALFDYGKSILGNSAGGLINQLLRDVHRGDVAATTYTLQQAAGKSNPREYVAAIIARDTAAPVDWDKWYVDQRVEL